jgi:hypothetical protein
MADASGPVAALRQLSARAAAGGGPGVLQLAADVYSRTYFAEPAAYLQAGDSKVIEDGGSAGLSSDFYREAVRAFASAKFRETQKDRWLKIVDDMWEKGEPAHADKLRGQHIRDVVDALDRVSDWRTAAAFLRENSLRMSKAGLDLKAVRNAGTADAATHTFHRDAGFVKAAPADLTPGGASAVETAKALNGPEGHGWVQGHSAIGNYKHRFIEHVHVNKGQGDRAFEIYNGTAEQGEVALAWGAAKAERLKPTGHNAEAVDAANGARRDADQSAAEKEHLTMVAAAKAKRDAEKAAKAAKEKAEEVQ